MIVAKSFHQRYEAGANHSRGFMTSMGSTELTLPAKAKTRSRTASRKLDTKECLPSRSRQTPVNCCKRITNYKDSKSASSISTCLRSTSKHPINEWFHPNSTAQSKKTVENKYTSRTHTRLSSESFGGKTTKKRYEKVHTQQSKESETGEGASSQLQLVYRRVNSILEQHRRKESEWQRDRQLYQKTIELLMGQLALPKHTRR